MTVLSQTCDITLSASRAALIQLLFTTSKKKKNEPLSPPCLLLLLGSKPKGLMHARYVF